MYICVQVSNQIKKKTTKHLPLHSTRNTSRSRCDKLLCYGVCFFFFTVLRHHPVGFGFIFSSTMHSVMPRISEVDWVLEDKTLPFQTCNIWCR